MAIFSLLNGTFVGLFGIILSAAYCDILWTKHKYLLMAGSMAMILLLQGAVYFVADPFTVRHFYPLITHLPLIIVLGVLSKKWLWSVIAVLTAYLCCQLRRWLALLIVAICSGKEAMQNIAELIITLPLLFILVRFTASPMRSISHSTPVVQLQFGIIPVCYYVFDYVTQIYMDSFLKESPVIVEFMPFVCSAAYLGFVLYTSQEKWARSQLEQTQYNLNLQITQAVREIENLRQSQQKMRAYRHDLRHHMQYLSSCIENGKLEQAQDYIHEIYSEIEANKVISFCKNEAANLIFSAYVKRAETFGIPIQIQADIPQLISLQESDLCVLLSNALENALHACQKVKESGISPLIDIQAYERKGKLFFQIINSCDEDVSFSQGIPVTSAPGHGIGVRNICTLVDRYNGIYTFSVENGHFILRVSI